MRRIKSFFRWFDSKAELLRYVSTLEKRNAQLEALNAHTESYARELDSFHQGAHDLLTMVNDQLMQQSAAQSQAIKKLSGKEW